MCREPWSLGEGCAIRGLLRTQECAAGYKWAARASSHGCAAAGLAHDLNNLLIIINVYAEYIAANLPPADPLNEKAVKIVKAGGCATEIVNRLLTLSRKAIEKKTILNLNAAVKEAVDLLDAVIDDHIEIVGRFDDPGAYILAQAEQIIQIVMNLVLNARDAMPEGGKITVETDEVALDGAAATVAGVGPGVYAVIRVSDNGMGMDECTVAKIFRPYFTTKGPARGTGLGLSTVQSICQELQGGIAVQSAPGRGSIFSIYLPRESDPVEARSPSRSRPRSSAH